MSALKSVQFTPNKKANNRTMNIKVDTNREYWSKSADLIEKSNKLKRMFSADEMQKAINNFQDNPGEIK